MVVAGLLLLTTAACSSTKTDTDSSSQSAGSTATAQEKTDGKPFKIGYICLCSFSSVGEESTLGAFKAWVKWTNANGGINGHPVELHVANDPGNPGVALNKVKGLVDKGIVALAENDASNSAAWASYIKSTGIPVFSTTNGGPLGEVPTAFSTLTSLQYFPTEVATAAKKVGASKLAVLYCSELANCKQSVAAIKGAAGQTGIDVPFSAPILSTAPNYTAQCLEAKSAGADSLFVSAISSAAALRVMQNCAQQGYTPHLISASGAYSRSFAGAPGTDGMIAGQSTVPFFEDDFPVIKTMNAAFDKYAPGLRESKDYGDPSVWQWTSGMLIAEAAKAGDVGKGKPLTAPALLAGVYALGSTDLQGMTPKLTFVKDQPQSNKCWFYAAIKDGKFDMPYGRTPACAS